MKNLIIILVAVIVVATFTSCERKSGKKVDPVQSFYPERTVYVETYGELKIIDPSLTVTSNGTTGEEWLYDLRNTGISHTDGFGRTIFSNDFKKPLSGTEYRIAVLLIPKDLPYWEIKILSRHLGLQVPHPEVALLIREVISNEMIQKMGVSSLVFMHEPIKPVGIGHRNDALLSISTRQSDSPYLMVEYLNPGRKWSRFIGYVFIE